jgi:hypothetical protein
MARSITIMLISLVLGSGSAWAKPPQQMLNELALWREAVRTEKPATIAGRIPKNQFIQVKTVGHRERPHETIRLDSQEIRQRLEAGQADQLGLSPSLLLPRRMDLVQFNNSRWRASDKRCPEVVWIFEKKGARWRLTTIERHLLKC